MDISISSRHVDVTPRLEEVIHEKVGQLERFLDGLDKAEIHFDEARNPRIADKEFLEITVEGHGHHLRAKVNAPDPFSAVDLAVAKLERQIRKLRTKLKKRHHGTGDTIRTNGSAVLAEIDFDEPEEAEEELPRIVKTKRFHLGPITPEEAALKMDLIGHGFFFFINKDTNRSAVVYRRDDGDVGLIDEAG